MKIGDPSTAVGKQDTKIVNFNFACIAVNSKTQPSGILLNYTCWLGLLCVFNYKILKHLNCLKLHSIIELL